MGDVGCGVGGVGVVLGVLVWCGGVGVVWGCWCGVGGLGCGVGVLVWCGGSWVWCGGCLVLV